MLQIRCVLKTGGCYTSEYVHKLLSAVTVNTSMPLEFVCLTDDPGVDFCETIELKHNWPGWWSKIELFRGDLPEIPSVYLDLDTLILGNIDQLCEIATRFPFIALRGFNHRFTKPGSQNFASGIMAGEFWELKNIYETFRENPDKHIKKKRENWRHGDQGFIADVVGIDKIPRLQNYLSRDYIVGKRIIRKKGKVPESARIIAWSGNPRIHEFRKKGSFLFRQIGKYWGQYEH